MDIARKKGRRKGTSKNDQIIGRIVKRHPNGVPLLVNNQDKI